MKNSVNITEQAIENHLKEVEKMKALNLFGQGIHQNSFNSKTPYQVRDRVSVKYYAAMKLDKDIFHVIEVPRGKIVRSCKTAKQASILASKYTRKLRELRRKK